MSEDSDVKLLVELATLSKGIAAVQEGQIRVQELVRIQGDSLALVQKGLLEVEQIARRAEKKADEAKTKADGTATEVTGVHRSWAAMHEALRQTVEGVKSETHAQTVDLKRLVAAEHDQALHRAWQKDQAAAAEKAKADADAAADKRRARWMQVLVAIATFCAIVASMYAAVRVISPHVH